MSKSNGKVMSDFKASDIEIREAFENAIDGNEFSTQLKQIFEIAMKNTSYFPKINYASSYADYIERWIRKYSNAMNNKPSNRIATPKKSCSDPAIEKLVQYVTGADAIEAQKQIRHHNLFMSAENVQGGLLEEYINSVVSQYGWHWCTGNVLRAIDFCSSDGLVLQVKNKSNTENSSSGAIRKGSPIIKWYRLGTKTIDGNMVPSYKWDSLNKIINAHSSNKSSRCAMSEEGYQAFLKTVVNDNPCLLCDR